MKTFVIAYTDFFDNVMKLEKVQADSAEHALQDYLYDEYALHDYPCDEEAPNFRNMTLEQMKEYAFDCDSVVGIMEI